MHIIDFSDPAIIADPYPALHALQDDEPAHWNPGLKSWCLTRYDDVANALRDRCAACRHRSGDGGVDEGICAVTILEGNG